MKQVTKDYFNKTVHQLDVVLTFVGQYPYTCEYHLRHGGLVGKVTERFGTDDEDYKVEEFFTDL